MRWVCARLHYGYFKLSVCPQPASPHIRIRSLPFFTSLDDRIDDEADEGLIFDFVPFFKDNSSLESTWYLVQCMC